MLDGFTGLGSVMKAALVRSLIVGCCAVSGLVCFTVMGKSPPRVMRAVVEEKYRLSTYLGGPVVIDDLNRKIQDMQAYLESERDNFNV